MSVLRRALGVEERAISTYGGREFSPSGLPGRDAPPGYGQPGAGKWGQGMSWQSWGSGSSTGQAMQMSAVFACLRLLSEAISTLPLDTFTRQNGDRKPYRPRPDYLSFQPPLGSRITYLSQVMLSLLTDGNAFVGTPRDKYQVPLSLIPLDPTKVEICVEDNKLYYEIDGHRLTPWDVMHIPAMTLPGSLRGVSPLTAARGVVKGGIAAQEYGSQFFANNALPPGYISLPNEPENDRAKAHDIAESWNETYGGSQNAGKIGVLFGGAKLDTLAVNPEDAQWLETKRFGVSEIARFYGVPPHLIADASNSTSWGSGLAEQNLAFGQFSLRPWLERIEDGHARLLTTHGLPDVFVKLNLDALLRASLTDRVEAANTRLANGSMTINEARRIEDEAPVAWGNVPFVGPGSAPAAAPAEGASPEQLTQGA